MTPVLRPCTGARNTEGAVVATKRRDTGTVHREADKTFLLSCLMCRYQGTRQTKKRLLNVESVQDHAYMLIKTKKPHPNEPTKLSIFLSVTIITYFFFSSGRK